MESRILEPRTASEIRERKVRVNQKHDSARSFVNLVMHYCALSHSFVQHTSVEPERKNRVDFGFTDTLLVYFRKSGEVYSPLVWFTR